jgi:hypothetical protein
MQMQQDGSLLFQNSSSIPERVSLISLESSESSVGASYILFDPFYKGSKLITLITSEKILFFFTLTGLVKFSSDFFGKIDVREGESAQKESLYIFLSKYFVSSW